MLQSRVICFILNSIIIYRSIDDDDRVIALMAIVICLVAIVCSDWCKVLEDSQIITIFDIGFIFDEFDCHEEANCVMITLLF